MSVIRCGSLYCELLFATGTFWVGGRRFGPIGRTGLRFTHHGMREQSRFNLAQKHAFRSENLLCRLAKLMAIERRSLYWGGKQPGE